MHYLEPFYKWTDLYEACEDELSPFYGRLYSEFELINSVYNYYIHPLWDEFGSSTLYLKILYTDYDEGFAIIEFIGEWNDCLHNDIMFLKRDVIDILIANQINKFILIGENVLNFHYSDDSYYQEWFEEIEDGWIVGLNFRPHVYQEFKEGRIFNYIQFTLPNKELNWRKFNPLTLFKQIDNSLPKKLY